MALLLSVACGGTAAPAIAAEQAGEPPAVRVVLDWRTGLALYGMDPVAYFSEGKALAGLPEFELGFGGAIWRFRNEGNRAAFLADPEVYTPRFAGRDPMAIARGVATAGSPLVWLLFDQRLYLFHAEESRSAFRADPRGALTAAETQWPVVVQTIDPGSLVPALRVGGEASPRQPDRLPQ
jgi:hypothetical protein